MTCQKELGPGRGRQAGATILSTTLAVLPLAGARNAVRKLKLTPHFPFNLSLKPLLHVHVLGVGREVTGGRGEGSFLGLRTKEESKREQISGLVSALQPMTGL